MIRIFAALVQRQALTSIIKPWKLKFTNHICRRTGVFWPGTLTQSFCGTTSKLSKTNDVEVEYPLEVCNINNGPSVNRKITFLPSYEVTTNFPPYWTRLRNASCISV